MPVETESQPFENPTIQAATVAAQREEMIKRINAIVLDLSPDDQQAVLAYARKLIVATEEGKSYAV